MKVDSGSDVDPRPALPNRVCSALAGVFNPPNNIGSKLGCTSANVNVHVGVM